MKYYVIPIDTQDQAYFGVRSTRSPYGRRDRMWCSGAPNVFGGNDNRTNDALETIFRETQEESHFKISIDTLSIRDGNGLIEVHRAEELSMIFYAIRGNFTVDMEPFAPTCILEENKYQECTGMIFRVNMRSLPTENAQATCEALYNTCPSPGPASEIQLGRLEFLESHMLQAIQAAANLVKNGGI